MFHYSAVSIDDANVCLTSIQYVPIPIVVPSNVMPSNIYHEIIRFSRSK